MRDTQNKGDRIKWLIANHLDWIETDFTKDRSEYDNLGRELMYRMKKAGLYSARNEWHQSGLWRLMKLAKRHLTKGNENL